MRPESKVPGYLWDALTFAQNVGVATAGQTFEDYLTDGPVTWAIDRQITLLGEALKNLRDANPDISERIPELRQIIGMRNILVHGYLAINRAIVWRAATENVPFLIPVLTALLEEVADQR